MNDIAGTFFQVWLFFIPFLLALCVHEYAHGWVANKLGDPTARMMGRLTLNPMAHADPFGTILLPLMAILFHAPFFGWAKPVPVNSRNLRGNEKVAMFWVAAAGPGSNVIMAFLGAIFQVAARKFLPQTTWELIDAFTDVFIMINLSLAIFNLIPVHPLDGGKIFAVFLPDNVNRKLEELQPVFNILLLVLFLSGGLASVLYTPVLAGRQVFLRTAYQLFGMIS